MMESESTRIVPIFPLGLVQVPGGLTPLHIFEPRYRRMLEDVMSDDKTFGIVFHDEEAAASGRLRIGAVGCLARVEFVRTLEDGRSNLLCIGGSRFRILSEIEGEEYAQAEIELFEDEVTFEDLSAESEEVESLFGRLFDASQAVERQEGKGLSGEAAEKPSLPADPQALSFAVIGALDLPLERKQRWLELTSTRQRLLQLAGLLRALTEKYEHRARVGEVAKTNGHSHHRLTSPSKDVPKDPVD